MVLNRSTGSPESPSVQLDLDEDGAPDNSMEASGWQACPWPSGPACPVPASGLRQVGSCHRLKEAMLPAKRPRPGGSRAMASSQDASEHALLILTATSAFDELGDVSPVLFPDSTSFTWEMMIPAPHPVE